MNLQPWQFVVVTDKSMRAKIAHLTDYGKFIAGAPACIAVFCQDTKYYLEDGSAAVENILLAATALGLGSCWVAGDKKPYAEEVANLLGVPRKYKLIALISLVVASVNIMNTMYTAVIERTKEIGVMKAIGARNSDILYIFIFESGFLGAVGGVLGVGLGYLVASAGGNIAAATGYSSIYPIFPWYLTAGCILFAFFVGAIAGIMPAVQASKLRPVDALRYE